MRDKTMLLNKKQNTNRNNFYNIVQDLYNLLGTYYDVRYKLGKIYSDQYKQLYKWWENDTQTLGITIDIQTTMFSFLFKNPIKHIKAFEICLFDKQHINGTPNVSIIVDKQSNKLMNVEKCTIQNMKELIKLISRIKYELQQHTDTLQKSLQQLYKQQDIAKCMEKELCNIDFN